MIIRKASFNGIFDPSPEKCFAFFDLPTKGEVISDFAAVVGPVEDGLALAGAAVEVARLAGLLDLRDVAHDLFPAPDLARIVLRAAAHVIAAIPLEPAARILVVDPTLAAPVRQRLGGVDAEIIERRVLLFRRELGA